MIWRKNTPFRTDKKLIIFGRHPVAEALESGKQLEKLFLLKGISKSYLNKLYPFIKESNIPIQYVPTEKLNRLTGGNHQGIVGILPLVDYKSLEHITPAVYEQGKTPLYLILDRISDIRNLGAIARTAECAGVNAMIIPYKGSAEINSDAIKSSSGALLKIPICREPNLSETINHLKLNGVQIVAGDTRTNKYTFDADLTLPTAIILGAEGKGISKELLKLSDEIVKIPITGTIDSYNVSVAAGILLYEVMKQRMV